MNFNHLIQRDPEVNQLTSNVFAEMSNILNELHPSIQANTLDQIEFVSFEQALKELSSLKK